MKTAEIKTASSNHSSKTGQPFFQKEGESAFFSEAQQDIQTKPFFDIANTPFDSGIHRIQPQVNAGANTLADPQVLETDGWENGSIAAPAVQTKCAECEQEEQGQEKEEIQKKSVFESETEPSEKDIQAKPSAANNGLTIGQSNDKYEQEADAMADQVVQKLNAPDALQQEEEQEALLESEPDIQEKPVFESEASEEKVQTQPEADKATMPKPSVAETSAKTTADLSISSAPVLQAKCESCEKEEENERKEEPELQRKPVFDGGGDSLNKEDEFMAGRSWEEAQADKEILFKLEPSIQLNGSAGASDETSVRNRIEEVARKELGKVEAKRADATGRRVGYERLLEYFHLAAPDEWPDEVIEFAKYGEKHFPHWCGIFSVYAIKKAGIDVGDWKMGTGVSQFNTLQQTDAPQKGDIGYIHEPYRHHSIVIEVNGDTVKSIDGNSGPESGVLERTRLITEYNGFFTAFTGSEKYIQKKEDTAQATSDTDSLQDKLDSSQGKGTSLDETTQGQMESAFGTDFSQVSIHTDSEAVEMNKGLHAQAFTHGSDIYFNEEKYKPQTSSGKHLLAHELTHTVQQGAINAISTIQREPDEKEAGNIEFDVIPEPPPRATLHAPYNEATIATELYADPTHKVKFDASDPNTVLVDYASLKGKWKKKFASTVSQEVVNENVKRINAQLSKIENAIDALNEEEFKKAGIGMKLHWKVFMADFPNGGDASLDIVPNTDKNFLAALPEDFHRVYLSVIRQIKIYLTAQHFKGKVVLGGGYVEPEYSGSLSQYIDNQTGIIAWLIKDTNELIKILKKDTLSEDEQWKAIGLLRQHMNPWNFKFMLDAAESKNIKFNEKFNVTVAFAFIDLLSSLKTIVKEKYIGPAGRLGDYQLLPADSKVKLLQPQTPKEIAKEFYGSSDAWTKYLLPYNRSVFQGKSGDAFIAAGTEIIVDPLLLVETYKGIFIAGVLAQEKSQKEGAEPYIYAKPKAVAVSGNEIEYGVTFPSNVAFGEHQIEWWVENDPLAVKENLFLSEKVYGPKGKLIWGAGSYNTTWKLKAEKPGNHVIKCRLTDIDGKSQTVSYTQVVMSLEEKTEIEFEKGKLPPNLKDHEVELEKKLEELQKENKNKDQIEALKEQLEDIRKAKKEGYRLPLQAVYVSEEDQPVSISLLTYIGYTDDLPIYQFSDRYNLSLWDFTMMGKARRYTYSAHSLQEAATGLVEKFADDAPYPDGKIKFRINYTSLGTIAAYHHGSESVVYPTDGGMVIDDVLRGLSVGALVIGVGAAMLGQAEIAIPAFYLSGILGGAAATANLADRLAHGNFEWDLETGMDILDIAGALVTAGMSGVATNTVKGVGKVTTIGKLTRALPQGIDAIQIGVMVGVNISQIKLAVESGDKERVVKALLKALGDGALFLIVHKAAKKTSEGKTPTGIPDDGRTPGRGNDSDAPGLNKNDSFDRWEATLTPETRKRLAEDSALYERYYNMDPRVRRLLTACRSDCIPREATKAQEKTIQDLLDRLGVSGDNIDLKEYLYDHRDSLSTAIEDFPNIKTVQEFTEFLNRYIASTARGGVATKSGDRWRFEKNNGDVVLEYEAASHGELTNKGTNSFFQSHHGIQDKWAESRLTDIGYNRNDAPALLLRDSFSGSPHQTINQKQTSRGKDYASRTYENERFSTISDLKAAKVPQKYIDGYLAKADKYFGELYNKHKQQLENSGMSKDNVEKQLKDLFGNWTPSNE